jgi:hypothetical protein
MRNEDRIEALRSSLRDAQTHRTLLAEALRRRRARSRSAEGRVPIALLSSDGRPPVPVVPGEILVPLRRERSTLTQALANDGFRRVGEAAGGTVAIYRDSEDDEVRRSARGVERLGRALTRARTAGRDDTRAAVGADAADDVAPNHVVAMNWVMKGMIGPEPTETVLPTLATVPSARADGRRPLVVVIDTGIDAAHTDRSDGWLDGVEAPTPNDVDPLDEVDRDGNGPGDGFLDLGAGHGTFVAGVVRQAEPSARVVVLRALDADGLGTEVGVAEAIGRATTILQDAGGGVLNLSLGMNSWNDAPPPVLAGALDALFAAVPGKVAVVAAAGNDADDRRYWPAAFDTVRGVAALTRELQPAQWSSYGPWVNFSAVGEGIVSTFVAGHETPGSNALDDPFDPQPDVFVGPNPVALWLGTSFAAPQVAAVLARYLLDEDEADAVKRLGNSGLDLAGSGFGVGLRIL